MTSSIQRQVNAAAWRVVALSSLHAAALVSIPLRDRDAEPWTDDAAASPPFPVECPGIRVS